MKVPRLDQLPDTLVAALRERLTRHPRLTDALIPALAAVLTVSHDLVGGPPVANYAWLFDVAIALPLLGRRRWPTAVFLCISAICLIQWLAGTLVSGDALVLLALYAVGAYESRRWALALAAAIAELGVVLAIWRWAPSGQVISSFFLITGTVTAAWVVGVYVRTRRAYLVSVRERTATANRERDQQAQIAAGAERARIAREMHDIVAHSLSVMIALNDGAVASADTDLVDAKAAIREASATGRQALAEMRRLVEVLRHGAEADLAPQPGTAELDELIARVRSAGLAVHLTVSGDRAHTPPSAQLAVYRIVQESLTNVLKHARHATRATVDLRYDAAGIDVEISNDDGVSGANTSPEPAGYGYGLDGIRERAAVFGGKVDSGRRPDGSWHVLTRLHLEESIPQ
jgi:signal transduction histidine kinase